MAHARPDLEPRNRFDEQVELALRHFGVGSRRGEVRPRPGQACATRFVDELRESRRLLRGASEAAHAGVDLEVNRDWPP